MAQGVGWYQGHTDLTAVTTLTPGTTKKQQDSSMRSPWLHAFGRTPQNPNPNLNEIPVATGVQAPGVQAQGVQGVVG